MIHLTNVHYTAIGRVTVESCTLDRELAEYLRNLGANPGLKSNIGTKLNSFQRLLGTQGVPQAGMGEFEKALQLVRTLLDRRNALAHGVWIPDPGLQMSSTAVNGTVTVRASEVSEVADKLRIARKLLLRLCQVHVPVAAVGKKLISASAAKLLQQL